MKELQGDVTGPSEEDLKAGATEEQPRNISNWSCDETYTVKLATERTKEDERRINTEGH